MAIFGMNGLTFLALDFLVIFAVYGMKEVALTKHQAETVGRVLERKKMTGTKEEKERIAQAARAVIVQGMQAKTGRYNISAEEYQKYAGKGWLR